MSSAELNERRHQHELARAELLLGRELRLAASTELFRRLQRCLGIPGTCPKQQKIPDVRGIPPSSSQIGSSVTVCVVL